MGFWVIVEWFFLGGLLAANLAALAEQLKSSHLPGLLSTNSAVNKFNKFTSAWYPWKIWIRCQGVLVVGLNRSGNDVQIPDGNTQGSHGHIQSSSESKPHLMFWFPPLQPDAVFGSMDGGELRCSATAGAERERDHQPNWIPHGRLRNAVRKGLWSRRLLGSRLRGVLQSLLFTAKNYQIKSVQVSDTVYLFKREREKKKSVFNHEIVIHIV